MQSKEHLVNQLGYSLVEYLVSLSVMVMVMILLFAMLNTVLIASGTDQINSDLHYSARSAMQKIRSDVLGAQSLQVLNEGKIMELYCPDNEVVRYYTGNGQLYRHGGG